MPVFDYPCQQTQDSDPLSFWCCPIVYDAGPTSKQHWHNFSCFLWGCGVIFAETVLDQLARYAGPMLVQCSTAVYDVGPTLNQHWANVSCLLCSVLWNEVSVWGWPTCKHTTVIMTNTRSSPSAGLMLGQRRRRWSNLNPALGERLLFCWDCGPSLHLYPPPPAPENTNRSANVVVKLAQYRRWWPSFKTTLCQRLVYVGYLPPRPLTVWRWALLMFCLDHTIRF